MPNILCVNRSHEYMGSNIPLMSKKLQIFPCWLEITLVLYITGNVYMKYIGIHRSCCFIESNFSSRLKK